MESSLPSIPMLDDDSITSTTPIQQKIKPRKSRSKSRMQWDDPLQRAEAFTDYNDNKDHQDNNDLVFYRLNQKHVICDSQLRNRPYEYAMDSRDESDSRADGSQMPMTTRANNPSMMYELHSSSPIVLGIETFFVASATKFVLQPQFSNTTRKAMYREES
jgi:hypothetical protein